MPRTFTSKVLRTMAGSASVRTTIPEAVAAILGAENGSTLAWTVEAATGKVSVSVQAGKPSKRH